jgi:hypothetical protein
MMIRKYILVLCTLFLTLNAYGAVKVQEIEVIRTAYNKDPYKYFITEIEKKGTTYNVTLKRLNSGAIMFFKTQLKCSPRAFRKLGTSEISASKIQVSTSAQWYKPVIGSIELDVINYICRD